MERSKIIDTLETYQKRLLYNLVFRQGTCEIVTLPAPSLFDIYLGRYIIMPEDIYRLWGLPQPPVPEPAPVPDPYQEHVYQWEPHELSNQWNPQDHPEYPGEGYFEPWP